MKGELLVYQSFIHGVSAPCHYRMVPVRYRQGRIQPPKAVRGHATYIDSKMLSVTKYSF